MSLCKQFFIATVLVELCSAAVDLAAFEPSQTVLSNCHVSPGVNSPTEYTSGTTGVAIWLQLDRFLNIDDLAESFSIIGAVIINWNVPCLAALYQNTTLWPPQTVMLAHEDPTAYWWPIVRHRNSFNDIAMQDVSFARSLRLIMPLGMFTGGIVGTFVSYCDLQFFYSPFDKQECKIIFFVQEDLLVARVVEAEYFFMDEQSFLPKNSNWQLSSVTGVPQFVDMSHTKTGANFSQAVYTLIFERKPQYYLMNLFAPSLVLSLLVLTSFLLPADTPDRTAFSCTIMLAVTVLQNQITATLPTTPRPIVSAYYVLAQTIYAMAVTMYGAAMCTFVTMMNDIATTKILLPSWMFCGQSRRKVHCKLYTLFDIAAFFVAGFVLFLLIVCASAVLKQI